MVDGKFVLYILRESCVGEIAITNCGWVQSAESAITKFTK